jgi:hypothetical protein
MQKSLLKGLLTSFSAILKRKKNKRRNNFAFRVALISLLVTLLLYSSLLPSFAQSPPTLDGLVDAEYISHGHSIDYEGIYSQANATFYVFDDSLIDLNNICLSWVIDKGFTGVSYGTNNAPDKGATNSATWTVMASSTLEDGREVSF